MVTLNFIDLLLNNGSNGYVRQQPSFTNSKAKPTLALGADRDNGARNGFQTSSVVYASFTVDCNRNSPLTDRQHDE